MKAFAELFQKLDQNTSTLSKVQALSDYFSQVSDLEAAWAAWLLSGRRFKRFIKSSDLKNWAMEFSSIPTWLFEECYETVGDLAETIAQLVSRPGSTVVPTDISQRDFGEWVEQELLPLTRQEVDRQKEKVLTWWRSLDAAEIFLVNKFLTGNFRVGVSQGLLLRALEKSTGVPITTLTRKLMGSWEPQAEFWKSLRELDASSRFDVSQPYPFYLASPLDTEPATLGDVQDWLLEWKWDGIRAQWVYREGQCFLWSRGEELLTERFPELTKSLEAWSGLPDSLVLDGEILAFVDQRPLSFQNLQKRISRQKLSPKILKDCPVIFLAYDILELEGRDLRSETMEKRRALLESMIPHSPPEFRISPAIVAKSWDEARGFKDLARQEMAEGLMLKRRDSIYETGRKRGAWWKWKVDPWTLDMVLIYAQAGHGQRAGLYTDYTFGIWKDQTLLPIAKAYSGLDQEEIEELDRWIQKNTVEKFGPVRSVKIAQVFEIAFEGIAESTRHRSGLALRFPRILRWRKDKKPEEADTIARAQELLHAV